MNMMCLIGFRTCAEEKLGAKEDAARKKRRAKAKIRLCIGYLTGKIV